MTSCIDVGIALPVDNCSNGVCPQPSAQLGDVLYAGPWKPHNSGAQKKIPPELYSSGRRLYAERACDIHTNIPVSAGSWPYPIPRIQECVCHYSVRDGSADRIDGGCCDVLYISRKTDRGTAYVLWLPKRFTIHVGLDQLFMQCGFVSII
ncbi:hypothetical protein ID866_8317 [Astraeus odoratus]|nr:hypothetical protein ID866_8317 [Astraeus odoratus]